jgi:cytochrome c biogenesis protein CcmG/thiol:disulfide interchange protein DsbE
VELQNKYGTRGFQVVGVALDEDSTRVEIGEFADTLKVNYPILVGDEKVAEAYGGLPVLPESFFVGQDGKVIERIIGISSRGDFEHSVKKALNAKTEAGEKNGATPASKPQN